jgi:hypothetical protein
MSILGFLVSFRIDPPAGDAFRAALGPFVALYINAETIRRRRREGDRAEHQPTG